MTTTTEGAPKRSPRRGVGAKRRMRIRLLAFAGALFTAAALIVLTSVDLNRFELPSDFDARWKAGDVSEGDTLHLGGFVARESLRTMGDGEVRFRVTDSVLQVPVRFRGVAPDLFREGQGVVTDGEWVGDRETGYLRARIVRARHDENYQSPDLNKALEKRGLSPVDSGYGVAQ